MADRSPTLTTVAEVLRGAGLSVELRGAGDFAVSGAVQDSRAIGRGDLFLAWTGTAHDAHDFIGEAAERGAVGAIVERFVDTDLTQLKVDDGRRAAAIAAHFLMGAPSERLRVAAVTGTNGKTTTTLIARHLLSRSGPAAALGTLGLVDPDGQVKGSLEGLTTPGPVRIAQVLARLEHAGVELVALEASSHALHQRRLDGIRVEVAAFANLSRDHLDYHGSLAEYREAKAHLLDLLGEGGSVVVNAGDPAWALLPRIRTRCLAVRLEGDAEVGIPSIAGERLPDLVARQIHLGGSGCRFTLTWGSEEVGVTLPLLGRFNVQNALMASAIALLMGLELDEVASALADAPPPVGRLEVTVREPVPVILDYAHTPDALERVLEALRPLYAGRLIVVFGAGGDRDREKRPEMGRAAAMGADLAIVTSDNPRTEDPDAIVDEILEGMPGAAFERITDRREAIARALALAEPGDAVLLAGKGHETYQIIGTEKRPFDERDVVREILDAGRAA